MIIDVDTGSRPNKAQGKTNANHCNSSQANDREEQQGTQRYEKYKPGHILVKVSDRSSQCWSDPHKHEDEAYDGNTEQQQTSDLSSKPANLARVKMKPLLGRRWGLLGINTRLDDILHLTKITQHQLSFRTA
ncbi:MAG: hypothetical protein L6461_02755 [Anaerolineae bacterium]|nr:hypothetical protein [Anaerolineae bacterium]